MNITIRRTVNLNELILPEALSAPAYEGESYAHTFVIAATKNGAPYPLSGSVTGFFERSDKHTVRAQGEVINGEANLTLPPECYAIDGKCMLTIMLVNGSTQTVIYAASGTVKNTKDGPIINGGEAIPSYEEIMEALNRYLNAKVSAKVEQTDEGAIIRASDIDGQTEAVIRNGKDGEKGDPGDEGFSPIAKVTETADGARIEITDKDGTTSAIVKNGKDGEPGEPGKDGDTHVFLVREIIDGISDKTKEEAEAAAKAGKAVLLVTKYGEVYTYYAKEKIPGTDEFALAFLMPITKAATGKRRSSIYLRADNALLRTSETPFTAVAENPLTIKSGGTEVTYDGSEKKEIEIVDNVFVVKLTFDENYNFVVDKTQEEVKQAVADGKAVIMMDVNVGTTLLYMGEGEIDGERCPFFVSPLSEVGMTSLLSNIVYLKKSGEVAYMGGPPINPLIIHYGDKEYTFDGSKLLSVDIKDDVFVVLVDANNKADQTQADTVAAIESRKAVLLVKSNGEVYTFLYMNVHPDYPSDYCPVFTSSVYGDFGEAKYRSLAYLLSDKTVVTRTEAIETSGGGTIETPTTDEILQALIDNNFLLAVTDSDGAILTDADGAILSM